MSDTIAFLRAWISDPVRVAAVALSSDALARIITAEIVASHGPVIELGPGTGAFTRALIQRGVRENDLVLVEAGSDFARMLSLRHPRARVVWMDAARLGAYPDILGGAEVGAVVSGLPILSMTARKQMAILTGCFGAMRAGAAFYQFNYGPFCPVPRTILDRLCLKAARIGGTLRNLPPASVYRITRRSPAPRTSVPSAAQTDQPVSQGDLQ